MDLKQLVETLVIEKSQAIAIARQIEARVKQLEAQLASAAASSAAPTRKKPGRKPKVVDVSPAGGER